jgi:mannose-6-phosphate isomerase-like protein (cupin superfamily)
MSVRVVVTGVDGAGRSTFVSDEPAAGSQQWGDLWLTDPVRGTGALAQPSGDPLALEPPAGGTSWRVFDIPPDEQIREALAANAASIPGMEPDGFHTTDTVDYVTVIDGEVTLQLDDGEVELRTGDCVVQRNTRHAWRNRSGRPVRMMAVMVSLREP